MSREMVVLPTIVIALYTWYRGRAYNVSLSMYILIPTVFMLSSILMYCIDKFFIGSWDQLSLMLAFINIATFFATAFINHRRTSELNKQENEEK